MPLSRLLRKLSHPNVKGSRSPSADLKADPGQDESKESNAPARESSDSSPPATLSPKRAWRKRGSNPSLSKSQPSPPPLSSPTASPSSPPPVTNGLEMPTPEVGTQALVAPALAWTSFTMMPSATMSMPSPEPAITVTPPDLPPPGSAPPDSMPEGPTLSDSTSPGSTFPGFTSPGSIPGPIPADSNPTPGLFDSTLASTWDQVKDGSKYAPRGNKALHAIGTIEDAVSGVQGNQLGALVMPVVNAAMDALEQTDVAKVVQDGIDKFFDGMPVLMNALDVVADLHPFIGVAVMAFKTVYTLELKRRDNEKKIIALYVEMKDMMSVLLQLQDVRDEKIIAPDQRSVEDRMKTLIQKTADDIKACSNTCDTYSKKKLLAKVFQGPMWDTKLLNYVSVFAKRRTEFEFALSIHMAQGVDAATKKLDVVDDTTQQINAKMDVITALFERLISTDQKALLDLVQAEGGIKVVRNNDKKLKELNDRASGAESGGHRLGAETTPFEELKEDLSVEPDFAIEQNLVVFSRKFEVQKRQIIDELTFVVKRETDRVIDAVKGGSYERILDKSIHEIWKDMGWRGNVKARHFVLALRDYYAEKDSANTQTVRGVSAASSTQNPDAWAIKFIEVSRVQPILEAFDDDASGFITVAEMNRFTRERPLEWSLPHWIAYWAAGWQASIIEYAKKIEEIFAKMEGLHPDLLPANRSPVDDYFRFAWRSVHTLTATIVEDEVSGVPKDKFSKHIEEEEARLTKNLKAVDYNIDGLDTLLLITGVGRIEKFVFPLIYLLMKRHYEIMRIARTKVISSRELFDGVESILYVHDALKDRVRDLKTIFTQEKLDVERQFKSFAYGIFRYFHQANKLWNPTYVKELDPEVRPYDDSKEDQSIKPEDILKHEYSDSLTYDDWVYDGETIERVPPDMGVESPIKDVLGHWQGCFYTDEGEHESGGGETTMSIVIEPEKGEHKVKAIGWGSRGRFVVDGTCTTDSDGVVQVALKMTFTGSSWKKVYFYGQSRPEQACISGTRGHYADAESSAGQMVFKRIAPQYFTSYPDPKSLGEKKYKALWAWAIEAVCRDVRRQRWSWSYFQQRRDDRKAFIGYYVRWLYFGTHLTEEEEEALTKAAQRLTPADACFYASRIQEIKATTAVHENAFCDARGGRIGGPRIICLDCVTKSDEDWNTLDLCDSEECLAMRVEIEDRKDLEAPHLPTHHLMKVRTTVLTRQHGRFDRQARTALKKIEGVCKNIASKKITGVEEATKSLSAAAAALEDPRTTSRAENRLSIAPPKKSKSMSRTSRRLSNVTTHIEPESDLPVCGVCEDVITLPAWYCCKCEDDLYICNSCDAKGVPSPPLQRSSGPHTEAHFLVRAQEPEEAEDVNSTTTEQRLISLETRIGNIEKILYKMAESRAAEVPLSSP